MSLLSLLLSLLAACCLLGYQTNLWGILLRHSLLPIASILSNAKHRCSCAVNFSSQEFREYHRRLWKVRMTSLRLHHYFIMRSLLLEYFMAATYIISCVHTCLSLSAAWSSWWFHSGCTLWSRQDFTQLSSLLDLRDAFLCECGTCVEVRMRRPFIVLCIWPCVCFLFCHFPNSAAIHIIYFSCGAYSLAKRPHKIFSPRIK